MLNIAVSAQVTSDELLHSIERLPTDELEKFLAHLLAVRARRKVHSLNAQESKLIQLINRPVPSALQQRYDDLKAQRQQVPLKATEQSEFMSVIEQIEEFDAERLQYLAELAKLRQTSLSKVMSDLGIK